MGGAGVRLHQGCCGCCAGFEQQCSNRQVPSSRSHEQWGLPVCGRSFRVCAGGQQHLDHVGVPFLRGDAERGGEVGCLWRVYFRRSSQQQRDQISVPVCSCQEQWRSSGSSAGGGRGGTAVLGIVLVLGLPFVCRGPGF